MHDCLLPVTLVLNSEQPCGETNSCRKKRTEQRLQRNLRKHGNEERLWRADDHTPAWWLRNRHCRIQKFNTYEDLSTLPKQPRGPFDGRGCARHAWMLANAIANAALRGTAETLLAQKPINKPST